MRSLLKMFPVLSSNQHLFNKHSKQISKIVSTSFLPHLDCKSRFLRTIQGSLSFLLPFVNGFWIESRWCFACRFRKLQWVLRLLRVPGSANHGSLGVQLLSARYLDSDCSSGKLHANRIDTNLLRLLNGQVKSWERRLANPRSEFVHDDVLLWRSWGHSGHGLLSSQNQQDCFYHSCLFLVDHQCHCLCRTLPADFQSDERRPIGNQLTFSDHSGQFLAFNKVFAILKNCLIIIVQRISFLHEYTNFLEINR